MIKKLLTFINKQVFIISTFNKHPRLIKSKTYLKFEVELCFAETSLKNLGEKAKLKKSGKN